MSLSNVAGLGALAPGGGGDSAGPGGVSMAGPSWLHCNSCGAPPCSPFYIAECSHMLCNRCYEAGKRPSMKGGQYGSEMVVKCLFCGQKPIKVALVNSDMNKTIKDCMRDPKDYVKSVYKTVSFQYSQMSNLVKLLREKMVKLEGQLAKSESEKRQLQLQLDTEKAKVKKAHNFLQEQMDQQVMFHQKQLQTLNLTGSSGGETSNYAFQNKTKKRADIKNVRNPFLPDRTKVSKAVQRRSVTRQNLSNGLLESPEVLWTPKPPPSASQTVTSNASVNKTLNHPATNDSFAIKTPKATPFDKYWMNVF